jgi:hypothetical protein
MIEIKAVAMSQGLGPLRTSLIEINPDRAPAR